MDRSGLKALAAKKHRDVVLDGATFKIKQVDFQEAVEALGERSQGLLMGYFFEAEAPDPVARAEAERRLRESSELQKSMLSFRRAVLMMGMADPVLAEPGQREDLDPQEGPAIISLATLGSLANELQGEILGGEQGKAGGE